jgi:hypothetical protein
MRFRTVIEGDAKVFRIRREEKIIEFRAGSLGNASWEEVWILAEGTQEKFTGSSLGHNIPIKLVAEGTAPDLEFHKELSY